MKLPIITVYKNGFQEIHKNYTKINRYKTITKNRTNYSNFYSNINLNKDISDLLPSTNINSIKGCSLNKSLNKTRNKNINKSNFSPSMALNNSSGFIYESKKFFSSLASKINKSKEKEKYINLNVSNNRTNYLINLINFKKSLSQKDNLEIKKNYKINYINKNLRNLKSQEILHNIDKVLTKFKINKLISKISRNYCFSFDNHNEIFKDKILNTLLYDKFINALIQKHKNFIFGKRENPVNRLNKYMINIENSNKSKKNNFSLEEIIKLLNEKDIKIILSDVSYFRDMNKNIVNILRNVRSFKKIITLADILNEEDGIIVEDNDESKKKKIKQRSYEDNKMKEKMQNLNHEALFLYYQKYINRKVNKDLDQRLKNYHINKNKMKKIENENVKHCELKAKQVNGKNEMEQDEKSEYACFRSFYNNITFDMKKDCLIQKNKQRLSRENSFKERRSIKKIEKENEKNIILKYLEFFSKINK